MPDSWFQRFSDIYRNINRVEQRLGNVILYIDFLPDCEFPVILLKDGSVLALFSLNGLDYEGLSIEQRESYSYYIRSALEQLPDEGAGFMLSNILVRDTPKPMAQRKIDADRDERAQRKVDQLRDQNVVVHENDVVVAAPLVRGYEPPPKPPTKPPAADNADSADDRKYQEEEEAIDLVLRGSMEAKKPVAAPAAEYEPPPRSVDGSSGGSGSQPAMFVYSREFGGARFVDKPQGNAPQSGDSLDDLTNGRPALMSYLPL